MMLTLDSAQSAVQPHGARAGVPLEGLELLATAVLLVDADHRVVHANPAAENLFEISRKLVHGQRLEQLFDDPAMLLGAIAKAGEAGASFTEQDVELGMHGKSRLHLSCTVTPVDGASEGMVIELRQIDQQLKIAREERLLAQQQANRELVRNLAHEIKNPLGGIRGAAQLLERELDRPQLIEYTQVIIGEADRLQQLVNRLLTPSKVPTYRLTNVHEILLRIRSLILAEYPEALRVDTDFDISIPEFDADPEQLMQAVLNVVRNAAEALEGRGVIRLRTRVARGVTLAKRRYRLALELKVEDNGPGVPEAIRDRIFFPLVSGRQDGSGLGLTLAQTFISQHHGTIECESVPGRTVFTILLPLESGRNHAP
jgi:two-component system nitrogen regulation sensor histidine kinase GlnL